jgi:hypothetical protein
MNLRDLLKKHETSGVTFHSGEVDIDIGVKPDVVLVLDSSTKVVRLCSQNKGEQQVKRLLEEFGMKTDNFKD